MNIKEVLTLLKKLSKIKQTYSKTIRVDLLNTVKIKCLGVGIFITINLKNGSDKIIFDSHEKAKYYFNDFNIEQALKYMNRYRIYKTKKGG